MMNFFRATVSTMLACMLGVAPAMAQTQESPNTFSAIKIKQSNIKRAIVALDGYARSLQQKSGLPGMAIAVVEGEKVVYARGFGVRQVHATAKVDPNTIFEVASVSKSVASSVVAGAVGRGWLKWSDPIAKYMPGFTLSDPWVGSHATVADMFSHRSGLLDHAGDKLEDLGYSRAEVLTRLAYAPLDPFRITYHYTNFGLTAGGQAAANAASTTWEELSKRVLYEPLGLHETSSRYADYEGAKNKATLHVRTHGVWRVSSRDADAQSPAGGVSTSVLDLSKWMIMEMNEGSYGGKQIIDKNALIETQQPQILTGIAAPPKRGQFYGLGIDVGYDATGRLRLSHSGAFAMGTGTAYEMLPQEHLGIVVLTNGIPMGIPETICKEFYDTVEFGSPQRDWYALYSPVFADMMAPHGELVGKKPPATPTAALATNAYEGVYKNNYYGDAIVAASDGKLVLTLGKGKTFTLQHWNGNTFDFTPSGENATGISAVRFTPASGDRAATVFIEYLSDEGMGTFTK